MKTRIAAVAIAALLAGCATKDVTQTCQEAQAVANSPLLALAPADVQVAASALKIGTAVCGSPEYAAARDKVLAYIKSRTQ